MYPIPIFEIFGRPVYLYGICIAVGIIACLIVFFLYTNKAGIRRSVQDFAFYVAIIAIVGGFGAAWFFQVIFTWIGTGVLDWGNTAITAMGGFVGGAIFFIAAYFGIGHLYFKGKNKGIHIQDFNIILRVAPCCITVAHAFGRIGCLMSGCCHGAFLGTEYVVGGIWMQGTVDHIHKWGYYVPTQLYESLLLFVLFAVLSIMFFKRSNITHAVYLIVYGVWRFIIEFVRTDNRGGPFLGLQPSQWMSILFVLGGIAIIIIFAVKKIPFLVKPYEKTETVFETAGETDDLPAENNPVVEPEKEKEKDNNNEKTEIDSPETKDVTNENKNEDKE